MEAGVRSVKKHLKRVLGDTLLTFEEFTTVLYQVEACLNSRPIGQISSDPHDLEQLTPGHFLIGRPLLAPPQPNLSDATVALRWKMLTKFQQQIWNRWSQEYLSKLQQRSKWRAERGNPSIGELVLVKDDLLPPQQWSLGHIVELHPGNDGLVRIVSVRYKSGIKKRPLNKLCQLQLSIIPEAGPTTTTSTTKAISTHVCSIEKPIKRKITKLDPEPASQPKKSTGKCPAKKKIKKHPAPGPPS